MFFFADMLWENSDFIGNSYPPEVCGAILSSMEKLSRIKSEGVITGMTPSEFSVLCCAEQFPRKHGGTAASVADIAALMGVSVPAVSRTLRSLQGRGWIERTIDEDDRRRILSVFTEDEMRDVARLYSKFASATAEQLGER